MAHYCSKIFRAFVPWSHITTFDNLKFFGSKNWFDLTWSVRTKCIAQFTTQPPSNSFNLDVIFAMPKMRNLDKSGTLKLLQQIFPLNTVLRDSFFANGTKSQVSGKSFIVFYVKKSLKFLKRLIISFLRAELSDILVRSELYVVSISYFNKISKCFQNLKFNALSGSSKPSANIALQKFTVFFWSVITGFSTTLE